MLKLKFRRDTSFRKRYFIPDSFAHPAKMDAQLLIWIVEKYTKVGDVILDPMFGSGTTMLGCMIGRDVRGVELEQKFVDMAKANWEVVKMHPQLGYDMGTCQIIRGDARYLSGLFCDAIVTSPPYAEAQSGGGIAKNGYQGDKHSPTDLVGKRSYMPENTGSEPDNISSLPYGNIDAVITSPPYAEQIHPTGETVIKVIDKNDPKHLGKYSQPMIVDGYGDNPGNLGNLSYGNIDAVITTPPYEETISKNAGGSKGVKDGKFDGWLGKSQIAARTYSEDNNNIGNLKGDTYLQAMLEVYQGCFRVLKPQGVMVLVTKNFIRNQQEVRLDDDTIKLCKEAGFTFKEHIQRELTAQSFWRVIYRQKYPNAPEIKFEDILVFEKN